MFSLNLYMNVLCLTLTQLSVCLNPNKLWYVHKSNQTFRIVIITALARSHQFGAILRDDHAWCQRVRLVSGFLSTVWQNKTRLLISMRCQRTEKASVFDILSDAVGWEHVGYFGIWNLYYSQCNTASNRWQHFFPLKLNTRLYFIYNSYYTPICFISFIVFLLPWILFSFPPVIIWCGGSCHAVTVKIIVPLIDSLC